MIAPVRLPETTARRASRRLRLARHFVAATLLRHSAEAAGPPIAAWKAWLFVGWFVLVTVVFGLAMMR